MHNPTMLGERQYESAKCIVRYCTALPDSMRDNIREVWKLEAGMKGKQHGSRLMKAICEEADKSQKILLLLPDNRKLELWYNRFGFNAIQQEPAILMMRQPVDMTRNPVHGEVNGRERIA